MVRAEEINESKIIERLVEAVQEKWQVEFSG